MHFQFWHISMKKCIVINSSLAHKSYTALKMDDIKKAPCGQAPLCSSESNMSNHVRMSFVLLITVANQKIWALEIFGFSGVRKWYKNVCKTAIFQAKRLIFCVNTYFLILSTPINSVLWFLKKKFDWYIIWKVLIPKKILL